MATYYEIPSRFVSCDQCGRKVIRQRAYPLPLIHLDNHEYAISVALLCETCGKKHYASADPGYRPAEGGEVT